MLDQLKYQDTLGLQTCSILELKQVASGLKIKLTDNEYKILLEVFKASPNDPDCLDIKYNPAAKNIISKLARKTDM